VPKVVDEAKKKSEIADAAIQVFSEHGFSETTVKQIAEEADISKGSIYLYFDSKTEILYELFQNFEEDLHENFDRVLESSDEPTKKLKTLMYDLVSLCELNRPIIAVLFDFWSHSLHSSEQSRIDFESFYERVRSKLETLLEEGAQKGVFRSDWDDEVSSLLVGFFEGQLIQWLVNPASPSLEEVKRTGYRMIMNGLTDGT
jgi:TetR/AcrR family fatty acid metabolism transcriptional regulator